MHAMLGIARPDQTCSLPYATIDPVSVTPPMAVPLHAWIGM
jgi:hypothetical protein